LLTNDAIHKARNAGWCCGAQLDSSAASAARWVSLTALSCAGMILATVVALMGAHVTNDHEDASAGWAVTPISPSRHGVWAMHRVHP